MKRPTRKATAADSERLRNINRAALVADQFGNPNSLLYDPAIARVLEITEQGRLVQDVVGDQFDITGYDRSGRLRIKPKEVHGLSDSPANIRELGITSQYYAGGQEPLVEQRASVIDPEAAAAMKLINIADVSALGSKGLRPGESLTRDEKLQRAVVLGSDSVRGYNRVTGIPFGDFGLDAGHQIAHAIDPSRSADPANIMFENKYMNRSKAGVEKKAAQENRAIDNQEMAQSLFRSFINKIVAGVELPGRRGSTVREEYMNPARDKVRAHYDRIGVDYSGYPGL